MDVNLLRVDEPQETVHQATVDAALDAELQHARTAFQWYDSRFAWSAAVAVALLLFLAQNSDIPKTVNHQLFELYRWSFAFWLMCAYLFGILSLATNALGMLLCTTPWSMKIRRQRECDGMFWYASVARYASAEIFAQAFEAQSPSALRRAKARELWRLSWAIDGRAMALLLSRILAAAAWAMAGFVAVVRVDMALNVVLPHLAL